MAGLRTNALVALGSALFVSLAGIIVGESSPTRIAAQVVSGIGFIGAGVIMHKEGGNVQGLNTAATLWCSAAVGTLAGLGFIPEAFIATFLVIGANFLLRPIARKINKQPMDLTEIETHYTVRVICRQIDEIRIRALLLHAIGNKELFLRSLHSEDLHDDSGNMEVVADLFAQGRKDQLVESIVGRASLEEGVSFVSWEVV
jgi:putative Mg2+ transporter-C (MgtC) family protein